MTCLAIKQSIYYLILFLIKDTTPIEFSVHFVKHVYIPRVSRSGGTNANKNIPRIRAGVEIGRKGKPAARKGAGEGGGERPQRIRGCNEMMRRGRHKSIMPVTQAGRLARLTRTNDPWRSLLLIQVHNDHRNPPAPPPSPRNTPAFALARDIRHWFIARCFNRDVHWTRMRNIPD